MALQPARPTRTLRYWLAAVAKTARKDAGLDVRQVSGLLGLVDSQIYRFENGSVKAPAGIDQYLVAYAQLCGMRDPREFYDRALALWRAEGEAPIIEPPNAPTERVEEEFRRARRDTNASPPEPRRRPDANESSEVDG